MSTQTAGTWVIDLTFDQLDDTVDADLQCSECGTKVRHEGLATNGDLVQVMAQVMNGHKCAGPACGNCHGRGRVYIPNIAGDDIDIEPCERCNP